MQGNQVVLPREEPALVEDTVYDGKSLDVDKYYNPKRFDLQDQVDDEESEAREEETSTPPKGFQKAVHCFQQIFPAGGIVVNCFQLGCVTLGGGIISMADSFRTSGILMSVIYLVVMCCVTVYTMLLLGYSMRITHLDSFEVMGRALFGRGGDIFVGFVLCLSCIGTAIAYVNAIASIARPILQEAPGTPDYLKSDDGVRLIQTLVWVVFLLPAIIPKKLNSIRYVSITGICFVFYFAITIIVHSSLNGLSKGMRDNMAYFTTGNQAIFGLSIFIFAFMCQGITYSVYYEMKPKPCVRQLTVASAVGMSACTILYIMAGAFGYLDFGSDIQPSILDNYDPIHTPYMMVSYVGMTIKIVAAFCSNWVPIRNFIYYCLGWNLATTPYWRHAIFCVLVSGIILVAGLFIPKVTLAFGLVGSLTGGFISFIFPALFWMYCGNWSLKTVGIWHWLATHFLLIGGVIAIIWGTIGTIYDSFIA